MRRAFRQGFAATSSALFLTFTSPPPSVAQNDRYAERTAERLAELRIDQSQVKSIRYALKRNPSERGPDIVGAKAWVRLTTCSGYLIVDMNRAAYILQTYTEGDCRVEGVPAY